MPVDVRRGARHRQRRRGPVDVLVSVRGVGVVVREAAGVRAPVGEAPAERRQPAAGHPDPDRHHERGGHEVDPGEEGLGKDVVRGEQGDEAERHHPDRVRDGDEEPEQERVPRGPVRPHQIGGDHGLAVAGRQGVEGAPAHGQDQREQDDADREVVVDQAGQPAGRGLLHPALGVGGQRADGSGARARAPGEARLRHRDGALEPVLRIRAQLVGDVVGGGGSRRRRRRRSTAAPRARASPAGRGRSGRGRRPCGRRRHRGRPRARGTRLRTAAPRGRPGRAGPRRLGDRRDGDPPPVDLQLDLGGALAGAGGGVGVQPARVLDGRALAEGGDLGHVDHLAQVELAAAGLDAQVAVDREVAQRVRRRDGGPADEQGGQGDQRDEGAPHGASLAQLAAGHRGPADGEGGVELQGLRQPRARRRRIAGAGRGHAGVEEHQRVLGAEAQAAGRVAVALGAPAGPGQDPAEHLVADDTRPREPGAAREGHVGRAGPAGVGADQGDVEVDRRAVGGQQLLHGLGEGEVVADGLVAPEGAVDVGEGRRVLRQGEEVDRARVERRRPLEVAAGGEDAREPGRGRGVVGALGERRAHLALGRGEVAPAEAQQPELDLGEGPVGAAEGARADGQGHQPDRALPVALQLARVGGPAVGGQVGAQLHAALHGGEALGVAPELDLGVGRDRHGRDPPGGGGQAAPRPGEGLGEAVAGQREAAEDVHRGEAPRVGAERARARPVGAGEPARVAGLAQAHERGLGERRQGDAGRRGRSASAAWAWAIVPSAVRGAPAAGSATEAGGSPRSWLSTTARTTPTRDGDQEGEKGGGCLLEERHEKGGGVRAGGREAPRRACRVRQLRVRDRVEARAGRRHVGEGRQERTVVRVHAVAEQRHEGRVGAVGRRQPERGGEHAAHRALLDVDDVVDEAAAVREAVGVTGEEPDAVLGPGRRRHREVHPQEVGLDGLLADLGRRQPEAVVRRNAREEDRRQVDAVLRGRAECRRGS